MNRWKDFGMTAALAGLLIVPPVYGAQKPPSSTRTAETVTGLNGAIYQAYKPSVVRDVQAALKVKFLYRADLNGQLDEATMQAIGEYQKANNLEVSGVPTPATRERLLGTTESGANAGEPRQQK